MLKIIICDDEEYIQEEIKELIFMMSNEINEKFFITTFSSGEELIEKYSIDTDILFLDISMGKTDGIHTAQYIRKIDEKVLIVFITSVMGKVFDAFKVSAHDFLLKPIHPKVFKSEFIDIVKKAKNNKERVIEIKNDKGYYKIDLNHISYITIEKNARNISIVTNNGTIFSSYSLSEIEYKLTDKGFYRCHKSFIVNVTYIIEINKNNLILRVGGEIPIGKSRKSGLKQYMMEYLGAKL